MHKNRSGVKNWMWTASVVAVVGARAACAAEDDQRPAGEPVMLPEMVMTGTRLSDTSLDQPYAFYRASNNELDTRVGRTALDRLNYGPGVFVQRTAPNQASPFIRGLTGEQTLLMLDGVRYNHAFMRPGPNQYAALIPGVSVGSVDAILGSSSVANGSDGLTGALDFRLNRAGRGVDKGVSPWLASRVDSGNGVTVQGGVDGALRAWAYSVEFSRSEFHDRVGGEDFRDNVFGEGRAAFDEIPNTAYDETSVALRLAYFGLDEHLIELNGGHTRQTDAPRPGGFLENSGDPSRLFRRFDPQAFSYVHLRDTWELDAAFIDRLQTTVWWHQFSEEQFRGSIRAQGSPDARFRRREFDDTLNAIGLDLQATTILGRSDAHTLTWGGTFIHENTDNTFREFRSPSGTSDPALAVAFNPEDWANNTSVSDDSEYNTLGLFAQDDWAISEHVRLLAGVRYSRYDWSFGAVDGDVDDVTGSARGIWTVTPEHRLFVGVSRGFRAPNLQNLDGAVDRGSSGNAAQGNPDLDPEISLTYEAGWKWEADRNHFAFTAFTTEIDDLIQRDFAAGGKFANVKGADLWGIESGWDLGVPFGGGQAPRMRMALVGSISLVDATRDIPLEGGGTFTDNISRANRLFGRLGLRYEQGRNWWGMIQTRWHNDYDDVARHPSSSDADDVRLTVPGNPDGRLSGYAVVDLLAGWRSDDGHREITFFIENLADATYREPGSGTDGVGRSIGLSASVRL